MDTSIPDLPPKGVPEDQLGLDTSSTSSDGSFQSPPSSSSSSALGGPIRHRKDRHKAAANQEYSRGETPKNPKPPALPSKMRQTFLSDGDEPSLPNERKSSPFLERRGPSDLEGNKDSSQSLDESSGGVEASSVDHSPDPTKLRTPSPSSVSRVRSFPLPWSPFLFPG